MNVTSRICSDRMANQSWNCLAEEQKWSENGQWPAVILHTVPYERICGVVSDSAAYCKKDNRDILYAVFPNSTHVLCLAHIVNLAADVFQKIAEFQHVCTLISMISPLL